MTWDPHAYPRTIREEVHDYERLQDEVVRAASDIGARTILDLGVGAGETAARILDVHPDARVVGIDSSREMLDAAARLLPSERAALVQQDLNDPLPEGRFDLAVSALAIHHLESDAKATLFERVAGRLVPGGRFVIGDVIVPEDPAHAVIEIEPGYDFPSRLDEHVRWLRAAGFTPEVVWVSKDLAVLSADLSNSLDERSMHA
jgi:tRNA (cmo5U34)-methyltransferase